MSYAQNKEDLVVLNYFKGFKGRLLEIGANDGITLSNSRLLIQNGWEAHLVEPGSIFKSLGITYQKWASVWLWNLGIGKTNGKMILHESGSHVPHGLDRGLVSTAVASEKDRWKAVEFKELECDFMDWKTFMSVSADTFDFISIDAEGMDWDILQQIDLTQVGCKVLCIEWNRDEKLKELYTDYCTKFGLKPIHRNAENIIFAL